MIRRREVIALLGGAAAAWPIAARAQRPALPVIGFLSLGTTEGDAVRINALRQGLKETGYVEEQNVAIEYRGAQYQYDRLSALAADLVSRQVAAIVVVSTQGTLAAKAATSTIPIVFSIGADPVQLSLVSNLNRPGGNITGVFNFNATVMGKRLELLHESMPTARVIGYLANPKSLITEPETKELHEAARALGVELRVLNAASESEIDSAFPTAGGLMSYGADLADAYRQIGIYAGRILNGTKPSDLPVQQVVKVELVINLKTAKALGLTVPPALIARADEVIE